MMPTRMTSSRTSALLVKPANRGAPAAGDRVSVHDRHERAWRCTVRGGGRGRNRVGRTRDAESAAGAPGHNDDGADGGSDWAGRPGGTLWGLSATVPGAG